MFVSPALGPWMIVRGNFFKRNYSPHMQVVMVRGPGGESSKKPAQGAVQTGGFNRTWVRRTYRLGGLIGGPLGRPKVFCNPLNPPRFFIKDGRTLLSQEHSTLIGLGSPSWWNQSWFYNPFSV